jgi:hypothetical protein
MMAEYVAECPLDEMNRPRGGRGQAALRIPPDAGQVARLFAGWREELAPGTSRCATAIPQVNIPERPTSA